MSKKAKHNPKSSKPIHEEEKKDMASWRPGGEPEKAKEVGGEGDFGVPAGNGPSRQREYVSENTRMSDPGKTAPLSWEHDGVRDHGAGARDDGPGSASGGDVDTDFTGVGTGGSSVSVSGPGDPAGPDDSDGTSNEFASAVPKTDPHQAVIEPARGKKRITEVKGSTVQGQDMQSGSSGQGADAATNPDARGDDSFAGEISSGEAQGDDLGISPSSDTQGLPEDESE